MFTGLKQNLEHKILQNIFKYMTKASTGIWYSDTGGLNAGQNTQEIFRDLKFC